MNIIDKIIIWIKNHFFSFYKSGYVTEEEIQEESVEPIYENVIVTESDSESNKEIKLLKIRNCIQDYSLNDIKILIDDNSISLPEKLNYHEEYIIETDLSNITKVQLSCDIECIDGEIIKNLATKSLSNTNIINVTDKLLGLVPITFSASVEDFIPIESKFFIINKNIE